MTKHFPRTNSRSERKKKVLDKHDAAVLRESTELVFFFFFTCFPIRLGIHDDKLGTQFTDASAFENGHQATQVLQVQGVAGAPDLGVVLGALHGAVQTLISGRRVAHKVSHVVGIWDGRLKGQKRELAMRVENRSRTPNSAPGGEYERRVELLSML